MYALKAMLPVLNGKHFKARIVLENSCGSIFNFEWHYLNPGWKIYFIKDGKTRYWTMKILLFRSLVAAANFFFQTNPTSLVVTRFLTAVNILYFNSQLLKLILTLLKVKKNILKAMFKLISINKKISSKKRYFQFLSSTWNKVMIILYISTYFLITGALK